MHACMHACMHAHLRELVLGEDKQHGLEVRDRQLDVRRRVEVGTCRIRAPREQARAVVRLGVRVKIDGVYIHATKNSWEAPARKYSVWIIVWRQRVWAADPLATAVIDVRNAPKIGCKWICAARDAGALSESRDDA